MRKRLVVLALSLGVPGIALAPFAAAGAPPAAAPAAPAAKPAAKATADAGDHYDPENITAISQYMETLVKGNARYADKDYAGAMDLYKKASQLKPRDPLAYYLLGEGQLAAGNLGEAEAAFKQAEELADGRNPVVRSHVLFAVADVYERQKKWDQARAAWQVYADHTGKVPDGGAFPGSASARMKAIDDVLKLDKAYELVRQRIAAEKDGGAEAGKK